MDIEYFEIDRYDVSGTDREPNSVVRDRRSRGGGGSRRREGERGGEQGSRWRAEDRGARDADESGVGVSCLMLMADET